MALEHPMPFLLSVLPQDHQGRGHALELLAGRTRSLPHILYWAAAGEVYVLRDPAQEPADSEAAAALTLPMGSGDTMEIRLVASAPAWRDHDVDRRLVEELADTLRGRGVRRMVAGVGNAELDRIGLLTRAGFRMSYVERDACTAEPPPFSQ